MKKKFLYVLPLISLIIALSACGVGGGNDPSPEEDQNGQGGSADSSYIYGAGVETKVVITPGEAADVASVINSISEMSGKIPELITDGTEKAPHEVVIGNTSREISDKARLFMERAIEDTYHDTPDYDFLIYYSVYSDGESVALVWSDDAFCNTAVEYFTEKYLISLKLELKKGYSEVYMFSKLDEMRKEEAAERELAYLTIASKYGDGVAAALKEQYALYDERFYLWLADLYDPGRYDEEGNPLGGGFYYSNSARDTQGYLIDIESTSQALAFLQSSGMLRGYGNNFRKAIPEKMQKEMIAFALSLQSPVDGYFYHPQWGTDITAGRLSRDMANSVSVLARFGMKPRWNTPGGAAGSEGDPPGLSPASALTDTLSDRSALVAVSKIAPASRAIWPDRLATLENWMAYIDGFEKTIDESSYSIGHNIAEQASQIKNRDKVALNNGEPTGYAKYAVDFFNKHQNPENGLWEDEVSYASINGLMKIMAVYNGLGAELNYAELAYASAVEIIKLEGEDVNGKSASNSVDVYNAWCSLTRINENITTYGSAETVNALRKQLLLDAEEMIRITTKKTAKFVKNDGSYGYTWGYSPAKSQGAPAAVPNTVEGDVNGGTIALTAITGHMTNALGISGLYIYYPSDYEVFINRVEDLSFIEKEELDIYPLEFDFEEESVGEEEPDGVTLALTDGEVKVVETERGEETSKVLRLEAVNDKGDSFSMAPLQIEVGGMKRYILQWDMQFPTVNGNFSPAMQITLGNMYILTLKLSSKGTLSFGDTSSTGSSPIGSSFEGSFNSEEWHNVRLEHYPRSGKPITKLFVDGELVGESLNYVGRQSGDPAEPRYTAARFYALFAASFVGYFDNVRLDADEVEYEGTSSDEEYFAEFDFEDSEPGEPKIKGMITTPNPEEGNSITVEKESDLSENKVLRLTAKSSSNAGNWIKMTAPDKKDSGIYTFEADIFAQTLNRKADIAQIYFVVPGGANMFSLNMTFQKKEGGHTLLFGEKTADPTVGGVILRVDEVISGWFTLRIEYDPVTTTAKITVNDTYTGETSAYFNENTKRGEFGGVNFFTTFATNATFLFDNISLKQ